MPTTHSCARCLLDDSVPGISIADNGLCTKCNDHDCHYGNWDTHTTERHTQLVSIAERAKAKHRQFDAVVGLSGGKDSTYALLYAKQELGLNCIAVTFDNGMLSTFAKDNIRRITEKLGVAHIFFGPNREVLRTLYNKMMAKTGHFCPVCMGGIESAVASMLLAFEAPLLIHATSRRTEEFVSREFFIPGDLSFIYDVFDGDAELVRAAESFIINPNAGGLNRYQAYYDEDARFKATNGQEGLPFPLQLPEYVSWDPREIPQILEQQLGWQHGGSTALAAEHMDCTAHPLVDYLRYRKFPALVPERLKYSALVSAGLMTREMAQDALTGHNDTPLEPANLDVILEQIGIDYKELEQSVQHPLRHLDYKAPESV